MAFTTSIAIAGGVARITLAGDLDAASAPEFRAQIEEAARGGAGRLVLLVHDLDYMASAGLRSLAYARQKMGAEVEIYIVGAHESIQETLTMTGFQRSVTLLDNYDEALH